MPLSITRRQALATAGAAAACAALPRVAAAAKDDPKWEAAIEKGLKWVAKSQSSLGHWTAGGYPTAMTALAGTALIGSGSTTIQGPYAKNIRKAVDYLLGKLAAQRPDRRSAHRQPLHLRPRLLDAVPLAGARRRGRRGAPRGAGRRARTRPATSAARPRRPAGGWGYVSAKDGNNFDEGSTTITQVQGLRGCRNAGIVVPGEVIDKAKEYIYGCKNPDGGISYSSRNRGSSRPAITAAALAALYNAGDYDSKHVPEMLEYCKKNLQNLSEGPNSFGHWHYTYLYYSQVMYRQGNKEWEPFRDKLYGHIVKEQQTDGSWTGNIGPIYVTACNLIMLQLDKAYLPIYQR